MIRWLLRSLILFGLVGIALYVYTHVETSYKEFKSPDEKHVLKVFVRNELAMGMPGQSGDRSGVVRLYDMDGRILNAVEVEMVQLISQPEWTSSSVSVPLLLDWRLPDYGIAPSVRNTQR